MNYGKALRIVRAAVGLQQQELAQKAGLTPSYVSLVEMGKRNPSSSAIRKLSKVLKIPPHLLALLATEPEDADLIDQKELEALGQSLVRLLLKTPDEISDRPDKRPRKRA